MKENLYIIDGSSFIFRAFYAIRQLSNSKGIPTNATMGFTKMLLKLISNKKPKYLAMVFDVKGKNFRHELFPEYKANRSAPPEELITQIPYIHKITEALNVPTFKMQGYEADDIIATLTENEKDNFNIVIVSGDKDLMQLVDDTVRMFDPMKNVLYDPEAVEAKMGLGPEYIHDLLSIAGDSSDNIPGVSGIGPKGACKLLREYQNLDTIYENINRITGTTQTKLINSKDNAFLSQKLTRLERKVPVEYTQEDLLLKNPHKEDILSMINELELRSLIPQLPKGTMDEPAATPASRPSGEKSYKTILTKSDFNSLITLLNKSTEIVFDTETTSIEAVKAKLVGISFSVKENEAYYIPLTHSYINVPEQLDIDFVLNRLKPIFENENIKKIGQNLKYDIIILKNYNIEVKNIFFDTMVASYILNPTIESHSLDHLAKIHLDHNTIKYADVAGKGKNEIPFYEVEIDKACEYASEDSDITYRIYKILSSIINDSSFKTIFYQIEMQLVNVLAEMEFSGVKLDVNYLNSLSKIFQQELNILQEKIYEISEEPFNINSTKQLAKVLFEKLKITPIKKTKTGFSTNSEVLQKLATDHKIATLLLEYRELTKLKNTYVDALPALVFSKTSKIHTSYNQTVTSTGRLSSSKPNLQNIPIRTKRGELIRKSFIPSEEGYTLLGADYNQIELRIMAHIANDKAFIDDFNANADIHKQTAMRVFNLTEETYEPKFRQRAKAINFGLIYGMGAFALSESINVSRKEAKELIDIYFEKHSGVKSYMDNTIKGAQENGFVETLLGRRRYFPNISDRNKLVQRNSERAAINAPIQGTSADIIKKAMINISPKISEYDAKMILQVHDELVFELPEENVEAFSKMIRTEMESVIQLKVPLLINIETGKNWLEAH